MPCTFKFQSILALNFTTGALPLAAIIHDHQHVDAVYTMHNSYHMYQWLNVGASGSTGYFLGLYNYLEGASAEGIGIRI